MRIFNKEMWELKEVKLLCKKHEAAYQPNLENVGFFGQIKYLWNVQSTVPNKSMMMLNSVDENIKKKVLQQVINDVEARKEEFFAKIENTCYGLGIGPRQTQLVIEATQENINFVKREARDPS